MANTFKNVLYPVTNVLSTFYTAPALTTSVVIGLQAANVDNTAPVDISIQVDDGVGTSMLIDEIAIPAFASLNCVAGKLILEAGDVLKAVSTNSGDVELTMSVLEIS